jgi:hypothetical protein
MIFEFVSNLITRHQQNFIQKPLEEKYTCFALVLQMLDITAFYKKDSQGIKIQRKK